ncbi:MAG: histidine kinase dimerization/phospho-acceptor domain-containing protein, partial [Anaerolineae bacterium]
MAALASLLARPFGGGARTTVLTWAAGCGLSLALPLLAAVLAFRVFRGVATPLADVMAAADAVAEGDLSARVPVPQYGPEAFTRLVKSFNRMAGELQRADQQRRNLTADVAHELRNPLHIIQGNLEGVLDGVYQPDGDHIVATLEETRLLARLVEDLRTLSLAEAGQLPLRMEAVDVPELLSDVRTSFSGQAEVAGFD